MPPRQLETLHERLLRAGVAPRHVRRYIGELRDHYEEAVREELAKGLSQSAAEHMAWARLGEEEYLAHSVLSQPGMRSLAARFPGIVFGAGPLFMWMFCIALTMTLLVFTTSSNALRVPNGSAQGWIVAFANAVCFVYARVLPVLLGVAMLALSARQRLTSQWPVTGAAIVALVGGSTTIHFSLIHAGQGQLSMGSSLLPLIVPFSNALGRLDVAAITGGVIRAMLMLAVGLMLYLGGRHLQRIPQV